jgi:hypothetical protein
VSCNVSGEHVVILWTERGGSIVTAPEKPPGFGRKMAARSMSSQLGGSIEFDWAETGVIVTLEINKSRLAS